MAKVEEIRANGFKIQNILKKNPAMRAVPEQFVLDRVKNATPISVLRKTEAIALAVTPTKQTQETTLIPRQKRCAGKTNGIVPQCFLTFYKFLLLQWYYPRQDQILEILNLQCLA